MAVGAVLILAACGAPQPPIGPGLALTRAGATPISATHAAEVQALGAAIAALSRAVSQAEADRAAAVALATSAELARAYGVTDAPLVHNTKVNLGLRPRGLCYHWADDLEARLRQEGFETLTLHRAIANADNPFRIAHSTVIVSARGAAMARGIVLDPWRQGGVLYWAPVAEDRAYGWVPREEVFAARRAR